MGWKILIIHKKVYSSVTCVYGQVNTNLTEIHFSESPDSLLYKKKGGRTRRNWATCKPAFHLVSRAQPEQTGGVTTQHRPNQTDCNSKTKTSKKHSETHVTALA